MKILLRRLLRKKHKQRIAQRLQNDLILRRVFMGVGQGKFQACEMTVAWFDDVKLGDELFQLQI